ncbi:cardiolipin synthase [Halobacillus litoralis]|uniref:cardiolipin synthase n=1 Tax=Halobacillus litoralis TaxID=45668 RepID=UPI001CFC749A|nr:cardiolipin synthase [Halobacillus litoralis]
MTALIIVLIILIVFLFFLDFKLGKSRHLRNPRTIPLQETSGDYHLYKNGSALYEDLFQDIVNARHQVHILFFLVDNDYISENFLDILKSKAKEGVSVRLILDRIGGYKFNKKVRMDLKKAGVDFQFAEKPGFPYFFYRLQRRNHRKITVIDGEIGYVGGFNIGKNYIGETAKFGNWRDYHLRLRGPVVSQLHTIFLDDWYLATGQKDEASISNQEEGTHKIRIVPTDGVELEDEFDRMIQSAEHEILIGTPYFIPTQRIQLALLNALDRDVSLHIMIPMKADHPFVKEAAIPYLKEMHASGAQVHFYDAGFYHSKTIIIDGNFADIGTANFDRRSLFLNKEVNTYVYDPSFISDLKSMYFDDAADAVPFDEHWLKRRSPATRINQIIAVLLRPFL